MTEEKPITIPLPKEVFDDLMEEKKMRMEETVRKYKDELSLNS